MKRWIIFIFGNLVLALAAIWIIMQMEHEGLWIAQWANLSISNRLIILFMISFALLPFLIFGFALWHYSKTYISQVIILLVALLTTGLGIYMIYESLYVSRGDQRGLIFIIVLPFNFVASILAALAGKKLTMKIKINKQEVKSDY